VIAETDPALVALVAGIPATLAVLGAWLQARKTRRVNTEEHNANAAVLHEIREDVRQTNGMLVTHIADRSAHPGPPAGGGDVTVKDSSS
jgi:hypothetical protein